MNQTDISKSLKAFSLPSYQEIPDVGLYLEQVTRYINRYLEEYPSMAVTGSMISNYVKLKIIPRVEKKAYSRDQIADVFFIAMAKTVMSMDQIRAFFDMWREKKSTEEFYETFRIMMKESLSSVSIRKQEGRRESDTLSFLLSRITSVIANKMYLDAYFSITMSENN